MRSFKIHLCQDTGYFGVFDKERPDKIMECRFNTNKEAICYALDKLLESPKKYDRVALFNSKGDILIYIKR